MNKYFSAALCCGLLLSTGKSFSAGTGLLEQLNKENIIGNDSVNPFIAPEVTPSLSHTSSPSSPPVMQKAKSARASDISSRQVASKDALRLAMAQDKVTQLTGELHKANEKITVLSQELGSVQHQKVALEQAAAAAKQNDAGLNDQRETIKKPLPVTSAQNVALESLIATLKITASDTKEKNADLTAQLKDAMARRDELNKQLTDIQKQKKSLEEQLVVLKSSGTGEQQKSAQMAEQLSKANKQSTALLKELAELKLQKKDQEQQLATLMTSSAGDKKQSAELTMQLNKASARSDELSKQLVDLQGQKKNLEDQLTALKASSGDNQQKSAQMAEQLSKANKQSTALLKELAELKLQKKDQEQQLATLMTSSTGDKKQSAELTAQLSKATARSDELSKQLADLQRQKKTLDDQLTALKSNSTGDKKKNIELTEQLNKTTAQAAAVAHQLAEMKQASVAVDKQLAELKKQKQDAETALKNEQLKREIIVTQLEDAKTIIASQQALQKTVVNNEPSDKANEASSDVASLKKQLEAAKAENATLTQKSQQQDNAMQELTLANQKIAADLAALQAKPADSAAAPAVKGVKLDASAAKDTRTSYAVGTWYGDNATREKEKMTSLGKKLDLTAFMQGFNDKVNNKVQLTPDKISSELIDLDKMQKKQFVATQSKNEKQSKAIMTKAANEKGAKRLPDGAVYRVIQQGEAPLINGRNEIITEIDEVLGTGKVMSSKEVRASQVKDLPPLFQTVVKKLGLGGEAKMHIPAKQAYGDAGVPGFVPPGTVSIITIKIIGIK